MIQVERADPWVVCRGAGPAQRLGPVLQPFLRHTAHTGRARDEHTPEFAVILPLIRKVRGPVLAPVLAVFAAQGMGQLDPDLPIRPGLADTWNHLLLPANRTVVA